MHDLIEQIRKAFSENKYPGDWCLKGSTEGEEPYLVEQQFKGKTDWTTLDPDFIDEAPDGLASALSFFSDEAFRFYLPAYLIADIQGQLGSSNPVFYLTHGLDDDTKSKYINPKRFGRRTWFDQITCDFAMFSQQEVKAIIAYLKFKKTSQDTTEREIKEITQSLKNYWNTRL